MLVNSQTEAASFSVSRVFFIHFLINHLILHHQHLSLFFSWSVSVSPPDVSLLPSLHFSILHHLLQEFAADLAAADSGKLLASLQGLLHRWIDKLLPGIHSGEPEAVLVGEVVAGALCPAALDEWRCAEVLQTGARRHQRLTPALSASCCVL